MNSPVILRTTVLILVLGLLLVSCGGGPSEPTVDLTPLGDAIRFLAIALVLGAIIQGVMNLWHKD